MLERASARETAARTAAGALCARALLAAAGIEVTSCTVSVGTMLVAPEVGEEDFDALLALPDDAPMRTLDRRGGRGQAMIDAVDAARERPGTRSVGVFEVLARCPAGSGQPRRTGTVGSTAGSGAP